MSEMVLDCATQEDKLTSLLVDFKQATAKESETAASVERKVNKFLDGISARKEYLQKTVNNLEPLMLRFSEFSWFEMNTERITLLFKDLIEAMDRISGKMVRLYADYNMFFQKHGIDRTVLKRYKELADELKERSVDLNDRYFVLPQDAEFQALMKELSGL